MRAVGGGEKVRRSGFTRKEQAVIDGSGEHRAFIGMPGQGMRVGTARKRIMRPARFLQRLQLAAKIVAEERDDLVDRVWRGRPPPPPPPSFSPPPPPPPTTTP